MKTPCQSVCWVGSGYLKWHHARSQNKRTRLTSYLTALLLNAVQISMRPRKGLDGQVEPTAPPISVWLRQKTGTWILLLSGMSCPMSWSAFISDCETEITALNVAECVWFILNPKSGWANCAPTASSSFTLEAFRWLLDGWRCQPAGQPVGKYKWCLCCGPTLRGWPLRDAIVSKTGS